MMIRSWFERMISHTGTETRFRLLPTGGSSREFSAMGENLYMIVSVYVVYKKLYWLLCYSVNPHCPGHKVA